MLLIGSNTPALQPAKGEWQPLGTSEPVSTEITLNLWLTSALNLWLNVWLNVWLHCGYPVISDKHSRFIKA